MGRGRRGAPARPLKGTAASLGVGWLQPGLSASWSSPFHLSVLGCLRKPLPACSSSLGVQTHSVFPRLCGAVARVAAAGQCGSQLSPEQSSCFRGACGRCWGMVGSLLLLLMGSHKTCLPSITLTLTRPLGRGGWAASPRV